MFDIPQSCSLTDPELRERRAAFAALPLIGETKEDGATLLRFRDEPGVEATVRELIRLEAECCPGIDFALKTGDGTVTVRVSG